MNKLERLGIRTDMELALHLPSRYEDETTLTRISDALFRCEGTVQIEGQIVASDVQYRPKRQLVVSVSDGTGVMHLRFLHFYPSQLKQFAQGKRIRARGELRQGYGGTGMVHPACRVVGEDTPLPTALTPVYPTCAGVSQQYLRKAISAALGRLDMTDTLPPSWLDELDLPAFGAALRYLHNPPTDADETALLERTHPAWRRMKFDELLAQQLSMRRAQRARRRLKAHAFGATGHFTGQFMQMLPFALTKAQLKVVSEIRHDLGRAYPMQRLLQGDVGSGKTVVAAMAALLAIDNGFQVAMMAPTEILAEQHFRRLSDWLTPLGVPVVWISGSMKKKAREQTVSMIQTGEASLVIGTHALIQDAVQFACLGLVIVDEQHRFGVGQRLVLRNKGESQTMLPHQLMMSATPIPRTLAMTFYADLDVSVIDELPPGRKPVVTRLVSQERREEVIGRIQAAAMQGRQVYWVCPLIEESESLQLQTAIDTHAVLSEALQGLSVGLVHGRMKPDEKQHVMAAFQEGRIDVLVATTVIEVGVDVPNASLMVIEHAERFGLSQLHQLRGRVGRGQAESVCLLMYQKPLGDTARQRLLTMRETNDGFAIAQRDLEIRGPGEFLGARQSGQAMLRFADLEKDQDLIDKAAHCAQALLEDRVANADTIISAHLSRWLDNREEYLNV